MKMIIQPALVLLLMTGSLSGCKKDSGAANAPLVKAGLLTGKVTDSRGNNIAGAKIVSEHTVWYNTHTTVTSNNSGNYQLSIPSEPAGSWTAKAQLTKTAWGQQYLFDLAPDKTDAYTSKEGAERNFSWKLSGERPGGTGHYGAHVDLYQFGVSVPMEEIKLVFTPYPGETTLIDGSPSIPFERNIEDVAGTFMVKDVPIGKYNVKAVFGTKTLLLDYRHNSGNPETSKTVVFGKQGYLGATEYNIEFWVSE